MKQKFTLAAFLIAAFIFLVSSTYDEAKKTLDRNFIFTVINEDPVLPDKPFNYNVIFPSHFSDSTETGYDGEVDTTILDFVTDDKATLGRVLFYDKKLSALENMSCGSCHIQEFSFAENKDFSQGISSLTKRNSMQLNDLGWTNNFGFFWDMSFDDMHDMIGLPLKDENEVGAVIDDVVIKMNNTSYYPELFSSAYGDDEISEERIIDAIVHFISSMNTFNSKFDKAAVQDFEIFSEEELQGLELFTSACSTCHFEGNSTIFDPGNTEDFTNEEFINMMPFIFTNGLEENPEDPGVGDWLEGMDGLYKLPTMRNIELTGPYMHDGRFETLDEVIDFYSEDVIQNEWNFLIPIGGFQFSNEDKSALKAFLLTLTDESFKTDEKWSDPFELAINNKETEIETIRILVSPNPMSTIANIKVDNPTNETFTLELFNSMGQLVKIDRFDGDNYILDKNAILPGTYTIKVSGENKLNTVKVIVQ